MVSVRWPIRLFLIGILLSCGMSAAAAVTGADWTLANASAQFPGRMDHMSVVFNNEMWVMGGSSNTLGVLKDTWHSSDGIFWTQANASAAFQKKMAAASVVFGDRIWLIAGNDGSNARNDTWYSPDGDIWTQANASPAFPARSGLASVVFNNRIWLTGGYGTSSSYNDTWYSSDGSIWTLANASPAFPARSYHTMAVYHNMMWVIGGSSPEGYLNDTWYSTDGIIWTRANASAAFSARAYHSSVVLDSRIWVIGGQDEVPGPVYTVLNDTWYSSDGIIWTQATRSAAFTARYHHTSLPFGNKMWVIGGTDDTNYFNETWYSAIPVPTPTPIPEETSSSGSSFTTESSVRHTGPAERTIEFTFGNRLSADDIVRVESVGILPVTTFSGDIECLVSAGTPGPASRITGQEIAGYQDISLNWIRADNIESRTIRFSVREDWKELQGRNPEEIVMLHYSGGKWTDIPTVFEKRGNGRLYFLASTPGFSLFAVGMRNTSAVTPEPTTPVQNATSAATLSRMPTTIPATMSAPAASEISQSVTVQPNASITGTPPIQPAGESPGSGILAGLAVLTCIIALLAGAVLVRRWGIRRQNPTLFRKY
ncbi:MAG: kelch repeat-containing protein [Methanoregulaceae archaeon]